MYGQCTHTTKEFLSSPEFNWSHEINARPNRIFLFNDRCRRSSSYVTRATLHSLQNLVPRRIILIPLTIRRIVFSSTLGFPRDSAPPSARFCTPLDPADRNHDAPGFLVPPDYSRRLASLIVYGCRATLVNRRTSWRDQGSFKNIFRVVRFAREWREITISND